MTKLKALIVDDEPHARELLRMELEELGMDIEIIGLCANIDCAEESIATLHPELVFLDIEMPEGSGIELLQRIDRMDFYPIMVTSHAEYAIDAIREHAFDYLLKPLDSESLTNAVNRVITFKENFADVRSELENKGSRLELREKKGITYLNYVEILYLKADGSYTQIITEDERHIVSRNLKSFEGTLDPDQFYRCNHDLIVNLKAIRQFVHDGNLIHLKCGEILKVSTRKKEGFIKAMSRLGG